MLLRNGFIRVLEALDEQLLGVWILADREQLERLLAERDAWVGRELSQCLFVVGAVRLEARPKEVERAERLQRGRALGHRRLAIEHQ